MPPSRVSATTTKGGHREKHTRNDTSLISSSSFKKTKKVSSSVEQARHQGKYRPQIPSFRRWPARGCRPKVKAPMCRLAPLARAAQLLSLAAGTRWNPMRRARSIIMVTFHQTTVMGWPCLLYAKPLAFSCETQLDLKRTNKSVHAKGRRRNFASRIKVPACVCNSAANYWLVFPPRSDGPAGGVRTAVIVFGYWDED